jgi:hypothetical protein
MAAMPQYRSAVTDALGRTIPDDGPLRVWLDDDTDDRAAPEGWVHLVTVREVCFLLLTERVVELSLDHDLGDDHRFGRGSHVIDFLDEQQGVAGRSLWPRDGVTLHTANSGGRDQMERAIVACAGRHFRVVKTYVRGSQPRFTFEPSGSDQGR